jgi:hypothetical protein
MEIKECYISGQYFERMEEAGLGNEMRLLIGEAICVNTAALIIEDPKNPSKKKKVSTLIFTCRLEVSWSAHCSSMPECWDVTTRSSDSGGT